MLQMTKSTKIARIDLENKTGKRVIRYENFLKLKEKSKDN